MQNEAILEILRKMYAKAFFEQFNFDAVTVAPYMGKILLAPFLEFNEKWVILLH